MPSFLPPARVLRSILLSAMLAGALCACAHRPVALLVASDCSGLVPGSWREGVSAPDLPADETVGAWIVFGDAAVAQLDKANGRTVDALEIVGKCEARDKAAAEKLKPRPWYRLW